jgi:hypothetical protein
LIVKFSETYLALRLLSGGLLLGAFGCSLSLDVDDKQQCSKNADCTARGSAFAGSVCIDSWCQPPPPPPPDPKWVCLGKPAPIGKAGTYKVKVHVQAIAPAGPIKDATVKTCTKVDPTCGAPLNAATIPITDANGDAEVEVTATTTGFSGFLLVEQPAFMPGLYFFNPPVREESQTPVTVQLASVALATGLTGLLAPGAKPEPDRGIVLLNAFDCTGKAAAGVTFTTDAMDDVTIPYYVVGGAPVRTAKATDTAGFGGFINMPATFFDLTGRVAASGAEITTISLFVRPGTVTYSRIVHDG